MAVWAPLLLLTFLQTLPCLAGPASAPSVSHGPPLPTTASSSLQPSAESLSTNTSNPSTASTHTTPEEPSSPAASAPHPASNLPPSAAPSSLHPSAESLPATTDNSSTTSAHATPEELSSLAASATHPASNLPHGAGPSEDPPLPRNPGLVAVICIFVSILVIGAAVILVKSCRRRDAAFQKLDEVPMTKTEEYPFAHHSAK